MRVGDSVLPCSTAFAHVSLSDPDSSLMVGGEAVLHRPATCKGIANDLSMRLCKLYLRGENGRRPAAGASPVLGHDPHWRDHALFYEYFRGDMGAGLGVSHQTGWTGATARPPGRAGLTDASGRGCRPSSIKGHPPFRSLLVASISW